MANITTSSQLELDISIYSLKTNVVEM